MDIKKFFLNVLDIFGYIVFFPTFIYSKGKRLDPEHIRRILIIQLGEPKELLLSTPAIRAVRRAYPKAEIHLFIREPARDMVVNNPDIDRIWLYQKDPRPRHFHLTIVLNAGFDVNFIAFESRALYRVGYTGFGGGFFLTHRLKDDRLTRPRHEVEAALEVVHLAGCPVAGKTLSVSITEMGELFALEFFQKNRLDKKVIAFYPGGCLSGQSWSDKDFAVCADRLNQECAAEVVVIGLEGEGDVVRRLTSRMRTVPYVAFPLSLTQMVSIIKKCAIFIGYESEAMHIAAALRIPVLALYCCSSDSQEYKRWTPWQPDAVILRDGEARMANIIPATDILVTAEGITVERVVEAAKHSLA